MVAFGHLVGINPYIGASLGVCTLPIVHTKRKSARRFVGGGVISCYPCDTAVVCATFFFFVLVVAAAAVGYVIFPNHVRSILYMVVYKKRIVVQSV